MSDVTYKQHSPQALEGAWTDLGSTDAVKAYSAMTRFTEAGDQAVSFLKRKLQWHGEDDGRQRHGSHDTHGPNALFRAGPRRRNIHHSECERGTQHDSDEVRAKQERGAICIVEVPIGK